MAFSMEQYLALISQQKELCKKYKADFLESDLQQIVGVAKNIDTLKPINGMRHPATEMTAGWYIWGGEAFSEDQDFFQPMHIEHLVEKHPEVLIYLGLAPGWRFLMNPDSNYEDVWQDESLLQV